MSVLLESSQASETSSPSSPSRLTFRQCLGPFRNHSFPSCRDAVAVIVISNTNQQVQVIDRIDSSIESPPCPGQEVLSIVLTNVLALLSDARRRNRLSNNFVINCLSLSP